MASDSEGARLPEQTRAVELAYKAIAARDRTVAEVRTYLERKRVGPEEMERAVDELSEAGFLDDERFARRFAEDKRDIERWGSERIERDLRRRGVAPDLIAAALGDPGDDDELARARALLSERVPPPVSERDRDRAWRLLVRKGYGPELAYDAVREHGRHAAV